MRTEEALTPVIGAEIDSLERNRYGLFPDIQCFKKAVFYRLKDGRYEVEYYFLNSAGEMENRRSLMDEESLEQTRRHIALGDRYLDLTHDTRRDSVQEPRTIYKLGLRYAFRNQYQTALMLFRDLSAEFSESE